MIRFAAAIAFIAAALPAVARDIPLAQPIDCLLGETCFIQNYVDADPGPGVADFTCGPLSYDGHKGTDFALHSLAAMRAGITITAAAPGHVRAMRDGEADNMTPAEGRDCGNGVVINHGGGWESQYCHMRQGSVAVKAGQRVTTGTKLGLVGLSGRTEFPHLHFSLRRDGEVVDPFNRDGITTCFKVPDDQLWQDEINYRPGGLIAMGIATGIPEYAAIKAGKAAVVEASSSAPALVVWAYVFGGRAGDVLQLSITPEDGAAIISKNITLEKTQAQLFRASGRRMPDGGWPAGTYRGESRLIRDGEVLETSTAFLTVKTEN